MAESEESFTWTESLARWSREGRAAHEAEREALLFIFFLSFDRWSDRCKVFQPGRKIFQERDGDVFFLLEFVFFILRLFCGAAVPLCRAVLALFSHIQHIKRLN